jgi:hypothetical protein
MFRPIYKLKSWIPLEKLCKAYLSLNPNAIDFLEKNPISIIEQIRWTKSLAPIYRYTLEKKDNPYKIDWLNLSANPNAIHILEKNIDKIHWFNLSLNPNAIKILENNQDKIVWGCLTINPSIFELDCEEMKKAGEPFYKELVEKVFHPTRLHNYLQKYNYNILEEEYEFMDE